MDLRERFEVMDLAAIESFIADRQEENLHLDFKTADPRFTRDDRRNLAEAISGFANSDGGLIVGASTPDPTNRVSTRPSGRPKSRLSVLFLGKLNQFTGDVVTPLQ